ncbi:MAG: metallophosphoesterase [Clostridiales bacterium]|jgi:predicted MPP superfamily phosphohydrolase|nr:metallophosphoesterase [Clostridiales bacterium]
MYIENLSEKLAAAGLFITAVVSAGCWAGKNWIKIKHERVIIDWLPLHLNGLKILHISDLHGNNEEKMNLDVWSAIERMEFDIAAITGDMVVGEYEQVLPHIPHIKRLARRVPVFYVEGNHEQMFYEEMAELLESVGVTTLENEKQVFRVQSFGDVPLIGFRDYTTLISNRFAGISELLRSNSGKFHIILSHQPQIFKRMRNLELGLVLSGHTHGGQVRFPPLPTLYAPGQGVLPKYGDGWYTEGKNMLYISRGIGTTVFPIRMFNRPELAVIELCKNY